MGITITNSKLKTYQRCQRQFYYKHELRLEPNRTALPLKRGTWLHSLLEAHYTKDGGWERELEETLKPEYDRLFDEEKEFYGDLPTICSAIMESYEYQWRQEDSGLTVIAAEDEVQVPLPHGHTFKLRFDLIVEDEYGRWLTEHKSHRTIPDDDYRFFDVQTARYIWALNRPAVQKKYGEITGILWNYIRTKPPSKPPQLKRGGISMARKYDTDLFTFVRALREYNLDPKQYRDVILRLKEHNTFFRRVRMPKPKRVMETLVKEAVVGADAIERGVIPVRSIDRSCGWCAFKDLCLVDLYGGNSKLLIHNSYHTREEGEYYGDEIVGENV